MQLKKPNKGNLLAAGTIALFFAIGAGGAAALSYYKSSVTERLNFKLALPEGEVSPITVDMSAQGLPKRLLQPGSIRLRARSLENKGEEPLPLMLAFSGIPGTLAVKSGGEEFDLDEQLKVVDAGGKWRFDIYIHLPAEIRKQREEINGEMIVMRATDRSPLAIVPISITWGDL